MIWLAIISTLASAGGTYVRGPGYQTTFVEVRSERDCNRVIAAAKGLTPYANVVGRCVQISGGR